jgi:hypothetical protein
VLDAGVIDDFRAGEGADVLPFPIRRILGLGHDPVEGLEGQDDLAAEGGGKADGFGEVAEFGHGLVSVRLGLAMGKGMDAAQQRGAVALAAKHAVEMREIDSQHLGSRAERPALLPEQRGSCVSVFV